MTSLVKELEKLVQKSKDGWGVVVLLDKDSKAAAEKLKKLHTELKLDKVALTVNAAGEKSPNGYKLNPKVKHTLLLYEKKKVVHNFAFNKLGVGDLKKIVETATTHLKAKAS